MIGLIGGTGMGETLFGETHVEQHIVDTPFGSPSSPIRIVEWHGMQIATLARHGEGHTFNPSRVPYRANIYALKALGVTHIFASGAVGSLREDFAPRELVIVDQVIDKTYRREPTFFDEALAVHVELAEPFCPDLRQRLLSVADKVDTRVHPHGTYVCMEGPGFSTMAESETHRHWGGELIGMTVMPEARLAREAEICYALVALVTDWDCWRPHEEGVDKQQLLAEIIGNLEVATDNAVMLLRAAIESLVAEPLGKSPIHDALSLAIWTDRSKIVPETFARYGALLEKYARGV